MKGLILLGGKGTRGTGTGGRSVFAAPPAATPHIRDVRVIGRYGPWMLLK